MKVNVNVLSAGVHMVVMMGLFLHTNNKGLAQQGVVAQDACANGCNVAANNPALTNCIEAPPIPSGGIDDMWSNTPAAFDCDPAQYNPVADYKTWPNVLFAGSQSGAPKITGRYSLDGKLCGCVNGSGTGCNASLACPIRVTAAYKYECDPALVRPVGDPAGKCPRASTIKVYYATFQETLVPGIGAIKEQIVADTGFIAGATAPTPIPIANFIKQQFAEFNCSTQTPAGQPNYIQIGVDAYGAPKCGPDPNQGTITALKDELCRSQINAVWISGGISTGTSLSGNSASTLQCDKITVTKVFSLAAPNAGKTTTDCTSSGGGTVVDANGNPANMSSVGGTVTDANNTILDENAVSALVAKYGLQANPSFHCLLAPKLYNDSAHDIRQCAANSGIILDNQTSLPGDISPASIAQYLVPVVNSSTGTTVNGDPVTLANYSSYNNKFLCKKWGTTAGTGFSTGSSTSFSLPSNYADGTLSVTLVGGGGGGSGSGTSHGGYGGAAGALASTTFTSAPNAICVVTIGAAGSGGGTDPGCNGGNDPAPTSGGTTSIACSPGGTLYASGGGSGGICAGGDAGTAGANSPLNGSGGGTSGGCAMGGAGSYYGAGGGGGSTDGCSDTHSGNSGHAGYAQANWSVNNLTNFY